MQYHSINIEKRPKRNKKLSFLHCIVNWMESVGADFKINISLKSNAFESSHIDESDIGGIYISLLERHFSAKVY